MKYSTEKSIKITKDGKYWTVVEFDNGTLWKPELCGLADMTIKICQCEDMKYINGQGGDMTIKFLNHCYNQRASREQIEYIYKNYFDPNNKKNNYKIINMKAC